MINDWGGARPNAGRPKDERKKVRLDCTVLPDTLSKITKLSFGQGLSLGEVVDSKFPLSEKPIKKK